MKSWKILLILQALNYVSFGMQTISGRLGSDLYLPVPEPCNSSQELVFDVYNTDKLIGSHHGRFQGLNGYAGRLYFNPETCTITLWNLSEGDGGIYKISILDNANHDVYFNVSIIAVEQIYQKNETRDESSSRVKLYVSAVLSLVPFALAVTVGIFRLQINYDLGRDRIQTITRGLQIFWIFSFFCQLIALCCWACEGCLGPLLPAILITVILFGDMVFCICRVQKHRGCSSRSFELRASVQDAKEEDRDESGEKDQAVVCGCWPRCGESSTFYHAALSPAVNPGDSHTEAQKCWPKCWKRVKKCLLWILLLMQVPFTLLVWISHFTMYYNVLPLTVILPVFVGILLLIILAVTCAHIGSKHNATDYPHDSRSPHGVREPCLEMQDEVNSGE